MSLHFSLCLVWFTPIWSWWTEMGTAKGCRACYREYICARYPLVRCGYKYSAARNPVKQTLRALARIVVATTAAAALLCLMNKWPVNINRTCAVRAPLLWRTNKQRWLIVSWEQMQQLPECATVTLQHSHRLYTNINTLKQLTNP